MTQRAFIRSLRCRFKCIYVPNYYNFFFFYGCCYFSLFVYLQDSIRSPDPFSATARTLTTLSVDEIDLFLSLSYTHSKSSLSFFLIHREAAVDATSLRREKEEKKKLNNKLGAKVAQAMRTAPPPRVDCLCIKLYLFSHHTFSFYDLLFPLFLHTSKLFYSCVCAAYIIQRKVSRKCVCVLCRAMGCL